MASHKFSAGQVLDAVKRPLAALTGAYEIVFRLPMSGGDKGTNSTGSSRFRTGTIASSERATLPPGPSEKRPATCRSGEARTPGK